MECFESFLLAERKQKKLLSLYRIQQNFPFVWTKTDVIGYSMNIVCCTPLSLRLLRIISSSMTGCR